MNHQPTTLRELYKQLPIALQRICGEISFPPDEGRAIMDHINSVKAPLIGASDASLKDGQCAHSWILTTGNAQHINDDAMCIKGKGAVDGDPNTMSSTRGELHGQTALAIISNIFLQSRNATTTPTIFVGDNKGVQQKCSDPQTTRLRDHRSPNIDLLLEYKNATKGRKTQSQWVASHQDKDHNWNTIDDLKTLNIPNNAILNIWCDKEATEARKNHLTQCADVYPQERWALFTSDPTPHKITGKLDNCILRQLYHDSLARYIHRKHLICPSTLDQLDTNSLHQVLSTQRVYQRANMIKIIHRWIPTQEFLYHQRRVTDTLCPRCHQNPEDAKHILICSDTQASSFRQKALYETLTSLLQHNTSIHILQAMEENLCHHLAVQTKSRYIAPFIDRVTSRKVRTCVKHQNIIGWDNFMRGYISKHWNAINDLSMSSTYGKKMQWSTTLIKVILELHAKIWTDRNQHLHGQTREEAKVKAREAIIKRVTELYNKPPRLAPRFQQITSTPLIIRLKKSTKQLQDWLHRVEHQQKTTRYLESRRPPGQLTIQQAFHNCDALATKMKYPP
jgi:hypothetical protein